MITIITLNNLYSDSSCTCMQNTIWHSIFFIRCETFIRCRGSEREILRSAEASLRPLSVTLFPVLRRVVYFLNGDVFLPWDLPSFSAPWLFLVLTPLFKCPDVSGQGCCRWLSFPSDSYRKGEMGGEMGRKRQDKMTNEACERQKDRVMAIKRQQASVGSTLVTPLPPLPPLPPLLLTGAGVPRRTSDEVKTGQDSVPPPCLFKLPLKYFTRTPFMLWKKSASDSHNGDSFTSCSNSCKITDLIHRTSRWRQLSSLFFTACIFFFTLLLYWKHSWPYLADQVLRFYGIVNQKRQAPSLSFAHSKRRLEPAISHV